MSVWRICVSSMLMRRAASTMPAGGCQMGRVTHSSPTQRRGTLANGLYSEQSSGLLHFSAHAPKMSMRGWNDFSTKG